MVYVKDFKDKLSAFFGTASKSSDNKPARKKSAPKKSSKKKTGLQRLASFVSSFFLWIFIICLAVGAIGCGAALGIFTKIKSETDLSVIDSIVDTYNLHKKAAAQMQTDAGTVGTVSLNLTSFVYAVDENGNETQLETLYDEENREWVDLDNIPVNLQNAFIAIEDERFYSHKGFDIKRTTGATLSYVEKKLKKSNDRTYGGSTITQQLIKNYTDEDDYSIKRKVEELYRAYELEKVMSKKQILELYLNTIYLSQQCNGVQSASKVYFGKDVSELTLSECATIAAITQFPSKYDPKRNPESNKERRNVILNKMYELGYIDKSERDEAKQSDVVTVSKTDDRPAVSVTSYYTDALIEQVLKDLVEQRGCTEVMAKQLLYSGGLKIYSAMDSRIQGIMDSYYSDDSNFPKTSGEKIVQSSMVIIDPKTGYVAGIIGGRGEKTASRTLNRATQTLRQPGSSIKPLSIYSPAVEYGLIKPSDTVSDISITIDGWTPRNDDRKFRGNITVSAALAGSRNVAAIRILQHLGLDRSFNFLKKNYHISSLVTSKTISGKVFTDKGYAAIGLGGLTEGISVLEMAAAYVPFASRGYYYEPAFYSKVTDSNGNVILERKPKPLPAISESTAYSMTQMLQGAVTSGTGTSARLSKMPSAGKTGTTSDNNDRWFVGYTPYYVGAVWYGYDEPASLKGISGNPSARVWKGIMEKVHEPLTVKDFNSLGSTSHYLVCADSGLLPNSSCNNLTFGDYTASLAPKNRCNIHRESEEAHGQLVVAEEPKTDVVAEEPDNHPEPNPDESYTLPPGV